MMLENGSKMGGWNVLNNQIQLTSFLGEAAAKFTFVDWEGSSEQLPGFTPDGPGASMSGTRACFEPWAPFLVAGTGGATATSS
jgi:hypothetical protein